MIKRPLLLTICTLIINACGIQPTSPEQYGYYPQAGAKLLIKQPITIKADHAGTYLQAGKNRGQSHSRFDPYCYIRFRNTTSEVRSMTPGIYTITASSRQTQIVAAAFGTTGFYKLSLGLGGGNNAAPSDVVETIHMKLSSATQPSIAYLECGGAEDNPAIVEPPSMAQMQAALGYFATLQID